MFYGMDGSALLSIVCLLHAFLGVEPQKYDQLEEEECVQLQEYLKKRGSLITPRSYYSRTFKRVKTGGE